jgi:cytochrome c oxidase subunit 2
MTTTGAIIAVAYAIAVLFGLAVSFVVWRSTRRRGAGDAALERYSRREGVWLVIVLAGLFALLLATIFYTPYGESAGPGKQVVRVTAVQFAWAVLPGELKAGVPVEFVVETRDVTHGFGVYDEDDVLLFQVQVIPDEVQTVVHTFDEPGTYEVLCLEYCGKDHHKMATTFEVAA